MVKTKFFIYTLKDETRLILDIFKDIPNSDETKLIGTLEITAKELLDKKFVVIIKNGSSTNGLEDYVPLNLYSSVCSLVSCGLYFSRLRVILKDE